jgi:hypothetical protein
VLLVRIGCSACPDDVEVTVESLDDVDREACPCGYSFVILSVAEVELA